MKFLTSNWTNLIAINYKIERDLIKEFVPYGVELDYFEDQLYLSLVAFQFLNTKVLNVAWPNHRNFEEVNLRFYIKRKVGDEVRRGVVFIKEIVPRYAISFFANNLFHENYATLPIRFRKDCASESTLFNYEVLDKGAINQISFKIDRNRKFENLIGFDQFILEHYWGYSTKSYRKTIEYQVVHDPWKSIKLFDLKINFNFADIYGGKFGFLSNETPKSAIFTKGSDISVSWGRLI